MSQRESWEYRGLPPVDPLAMPPRSSGTFALPWVMVAIAVSLVAYLAYTWNEQGVEIALANPMAAIAPEDPNLTIIRRWLRENLDNPEFEVVRFWGPVKCQKSFDSWIETRTEREKLRETAVERQDLDTIINSMMQLPGDDSGSVKARGVPLLLRVKYRTENGFGALVLHDQVFWIRNNQVFQVSDLDNWSSLTGVTNLAPEDLSILTAY